jgi:P4 family phage/plasmid primase-like protien
MLKQDNIELFKELIKDRNDFLDLVMNDATNYGVAQFIYNNIIFDYLYDGNTNWWGVKSNSLWENSGKTAPPSIRTKIVRIMTENRLLLEKTILKQKQKLCDSENFDKAKLERLEKINGFILDFKKKVESDSFIKGVIGFLQSLYDENTKLILEQNEVSCVAELMDANAYIFAFTDCLYDFKIKKFRAILPTDFISITCGYKKPVSNPSTRELLVQTLKTIWEDDAVYQYFIDIVSSCMCGVRNMEAFFIATGKGRNGKGLIFELIMNVLGAYFYALPEQALCKRIDNPTSATPFIADLRGKRMAMTTEPEESENLMEGTIKKMTGGDKLTGRALYGNPITFKPQFGLFLQANNVPNFNSLTPALVKRLVVIPFPLVFVENPVSNTNQRKGNPDIKNKYCVSNEWRDEMCLYLLENYERVAGKAIDALETPNKVKEATSEYTEENNSVGAWFKEKYEISDNSKDYPRSSEVLQHYYFDTKIKMTPKSFKSALAFNDIEIKKDSKGFMVIKAWKKKYIVNEEIQEEC